MRVLEKVKVGDLLVAEPFLDDPNFKRSVVLVADHFEDGSVGFVLNRPLRVNISSLISGFPKFPAQVFAGGPVQRDTVHYLHTVGEIIDGAKEIAKGIYWGGDFEKLKFLIQSEVISPHDIRFYLGYSGWGEGQLKEEREIYKSWIVADSDPNYVFYNTDKVNLWEQVLQHKGDTFSVISTMPDQNWEN
ncbi:MAG: YqgE/AlgH family protein [Saprospiraceae bacterium]|nr:YqgE/AlgH family protein [Saprospiraceae bacterium]